MRRRALMLAGLLLLASCGARDDCPTCEIKVERIAVFGESDGDGALESRPLVSAEFAGRRVVLMPEGSRLLPRLFSAEGRFISVLGSVGDGPGEFVSPMRTFVRRDTAWIEDLIHSRATAVTSSGLAQTTVLWQRHANDAIVGEDDSWILAGGDGYRRVMAVASPTGAVLREFGDTMVPFGARRFLAHDRNSFWSAASLYRLRFEEWASPDSLIRVIEPITPHFRPYEKVQLATPERPPIPALRGFWTDSLNRIWAVLEVPGVDWRSGYGEPRPGEGGEMYMPKLDINRAYQTVLLVIDPATSKVVAERSIEGWFYSVVEPWVILRAAEDDDGWYRAELWRVFGAVP